ncbi:hypothetical protein LCGC14_3035270 [marine sediment metagenome]|uniref:Uncharacterized protein n=1 Tax=marine sediment metagenome TaxID=412755 RepID=A0A0F8WR29_9ZZZZ
MNKLNEEKEIVERNKGNIKELMNHLENELHLSAIIQNKLSDGLQKSLMQQRSIHLQIIKTNFQIELIKYEENGDLKVGG